ncbi:MAG: hypothetical protein AAGC55_28660 [Myxococcota bacterium]
MNQRTRFSVVALIFALFAVTSTACGTTVQFTPTNPSPTAMQPRPPGEVHVYTSSRPEVPFVEVGIIQARQSRQFSLDDLPEIINSMRIEAANIGCDGVIINGTDGKTVGGSSTGDGTVSTLEGYWGSCIMYRQQPPVGA